MKKLTMVYLYGGVCAQFVGAFLPGDLTFIVGTMFALTGVILLRLDDMEQATQ